MYASSTAILGGYQHDLPIVVFACVEELYRTGESSASSSATWILSILYRYRSLWTVANLNIQIQGYIKKDYSELSLTGLVSFSSSVASTQGLISVILMQLLAAPVILV